MKKAVNVILTGGVMALLAALLNGCASCKPGKPGPVGHYTIEVKLADSLKNSSVVVDLIGANASTLPRLMAYDMGNYWKPGDPLRRDMDPLPLSFVSGQEITKSMDLNDPHWAAWKSQGVTHLVVLADLPRVASSLPGTQDPRREMLSLDTCSWPKKTTTLSVLVQPSGIRILTPPRSAQ